VCVVSWETRGMGKRQMELTSKLYRYGFLVNYTFEDASSDRGMRSPATDGGLP